MLVVCIFFILFYVFAALINKIIATIIVDAVVHLQIISFHTTVRRLRQGERTIVAEYNHDRNKACCKNRKN